MSLLLAHGETGLSWFPKSLPPLHPVLVSFTAALLPVSLLSDVMGRLLHRQSLCAAGWWTLLYSAILTPFTVLAGWLWMRQMDSMDMPAMDVHKWLGLALSLAFIGLAVWRYQIYRRPDEPPGWTYLICTMLVFAALVVQGHLGGAMSFASMDVVGRDAEFLGNGRDRLAGVGFENHRVVSEVNFRLAGKAKSIQFVRLLAGGRDTATHANLPAAPLPGDTSGNCDWLEGIFRGST
jgi:uncharacterized membrane protein